MNTHAERNAATLFKAPVQVDSPLEGDDLRFTGGRWTNAPPSGSAASFIFNEVPIGLINGSNTIFNTIHPIGSSLRVYLNGINIGNHFTQNTANTFTIEDAPLLGDVVLVDYIRL